MNGKAKYDFSRYDIARDEEKLDHSGFVLDLSEDGTHDTVLWIDIDLYGGEIHIPEYTSPPKTKMHCSECGAYISRYNKGTVCAPCEKSRGNVIVERYTPPRNTTRDARDARKAHERYLAMRERQLAQDAEAYTEAKKALARIDRMAELRVTIQTEVNRASVISPTYKAGECPSCQQPATKPGVILCQTCNRDIVGDIFDKMWKED